MAKGYWITFYRSISDPAALAAYGKLAGPAIVANGGRFLARGEAAKAYEQGIAQRTTVTATRASGTFASSEEWTNVRADGADPRVGLGQTYRPSLRRSGLRASAIRTCSA
jgi:uncharacterized protein (DUF1330 family)